MSWYKTVKHSGYVQPPEKIVENIYNLSKPYLVAYWNKYNIKKINLLLDKDLNKIKELQKSRGVLTNKEKNDAIQSIQRNIIKNKKIINDISSQEVVKIPDVLSDESITQYTVPFYDLKGSLTVDIVYGKTYSSSSDRALYYSNVEKQDNKIIVDTNVLAGVMTIYLKPLIYNNDKLVDALHELKNHISHEFVHFMQESMSVNGNLYGMPSKKISNPEKTYEERIEMPSKTFKQKYEKYKYHTLIDDEFYPSLFTEIQGLKNMMNIHNYKTFSFPKFIESNDFFYSLKDGNKEKYFKAVKEAHKVYMNEFNKYDRMLNK